MSKNFKIRILFFVFLFISGLTEGQELITPYSSIYPFLDQNELNPLNIEQAVKPFEKYAKTNKEAKNLAIQFSQILNGKGIILEESIIPKEKDYKDSITGRFEWSPSTELSGVYLEKISDKWVFNKKSIERIKTIHTNTFPYGLDRLLTRLPQLGTTRVFGLYAYQYIAILTLILLAIILYKVISFIFNSIFLRIVKKAGYEHLAKGYLLPVARPASLLVIFSLLLFLLPALQLRPSISYYIILIFKGLIPFFGLLMFYRIAHIFSLYLQKIAQNTNNSLDVQRVPLIRITLKVLVILIGVLFILNSLNIDIIPLLTGLSIGGLAVALAAQDTLKNFFGSLMIFLDKPFQIGDWITSGDIDGTVEEVGFRSSRIRTLRDSIMYVPNSKLADAVIDNNGLRRYRRFYCTLNLVYGTPVKQIEAFKSGLESIVEQHPNTRKDYYNIYFNEMGTSSLNVMFYIFFEVKDWQEELKARHEILLEILKLAGNLRIQFAFPTQTLHIENFPGKISGSPIFPNDQEVQNLLNQWAKKN